MGRTSLEQTTNHRGALSVGGREGVHQVGQEQGGLGRDILALVRNSTKLSNKPQLREMGRFVGRGVMIRQRQQMGFVVGWSQWQARKGSEGKHWATHQRRAEANNGAIQVSLGYQNRGSTRLQRVRGIAFAAWWDVETRECTSLSRHGDSIVTSSRGSKSAAKLGGVVRISAPITIKLIKHFKKC